MLKKWTALGLCIFTIISENVFAADLPGQYTPEENFEYSGNMIGHALKAATPKIIYQRQCKMRYRPVELDFSSLVNFIAQYADYNDMDAVMNYVYDHISQHLSYGEAKEIEAGFAASGSGVLISDDGYIATNEHVIYTSEEEAKEAYLGQGISEVQEDYNKFMSQLESVFGSDKITDDVREKWAEGFLKFYVDEVKIIDESDPEIYVCFPDADGNADLDSGNVFEARVLKEGKVSGDAGDTTDAAILKIDTDNMISLNISDNYPDTNSVITTAGFPGASSPFAEQGNTEDELTVTVTSGTIARIVKIDDSLYQSIQITATIDHGNSGGPSVDNNMNIEGLNTLKGSTGYYFMVPAEVIKDWSAGYPIGQGETSKIFMAGLQALQKGENAKALKCFEEVKSRQPNVPYINELIRDVSSASGEAASIIDFLDNIDMGDVGIVIAVAGAGAIILIIIALVVSANKKNKRRKAASSISLPSDFDFTSATEDDSSFTGDYDFRSSGNNDDFGGGEW